MRGVASLWIVIFHYFSRYELVSPLKTIINNGYVAVDIFFVLSAFLLTMVYNKKMEIVDFKLFTLFYKKRINRIYPIYFFTLVFITVTIGANFKTFIFNSLLIQCFFNIKYLVNIVYWSLSTESVSYTHLDVYKRQSHNRVLVLEVMGRYAGWILSLIHI